MVEIEDLGTVFIIDVNDYDKHDKVLDTMHWEAIIEVPSLGQLDMEVEFKRPGDAINALYKWAADRSLLLTVPTMTVRRVKHG